jgi:hypothetical protein
VLWSFWVRFLIDVKILEMRKRAATGASGLVARDRAKVELGKSTQDPH